MSPLPDDRQALHRENLRVSGHLNGLAALKKRRVVRDDDTMPEATAPTPVIPISVPRPTARIQSPPSAPEPEAANGFFDDFETDAVLPKPPEDGFTINDDSTAMTTENINHDTGRFSTSAEETSDEMQRPPTTAPQGEAINDILDGFNW